MTSEKRRAVGSRGAAPTLQPVAATPPAAALADLLAAAVAQQRAGALGEAERRYRHILALSPNHADAYSRLGAVMMRQGKTADAIAHIERALALKPDLFEAHANLAQACMGVGRTEDAIEAACRALELKETAQSKALFARCVEYARFTAPDARYRNLVLRALVEGWAPPYKLTAVCISLLKLDVVVNNGIARVASAWPTRLSAADLFDSAELAALARNELLCRLLQCDAASDVGLDRLLTNLRYAMLTGAAADGAVDEDLLEFYCSVAQQCFVNEYVFSLTDGEAGRAQRLREKLEQALAAGESCPPLWPVIVGAYFPLHGLANAEALLGRSWPQCVNALLVQQVSEPREERQIAAALPLLTGIADQVSEAVRRQYEENPYPRWTMAAPPPSPALSAAASGPIPDVLIAGCGTGLVILEMSSALRRAHTLAIDLSRASLSYAKRMSNKLGLADIEFAQADILELGSIGREFDFIDAAGVLHHLSDPWEGWRVLLSLLRPGGAMRIALYSAMARRNVAAARALIAERGYRPVAQDIRRCREDIFASENPVLKSLLEARDLFTTSECRDLLFHVQEVRITLPEIKSFVAANKLKFAGFNLEPVTLQKFAARFPGQAALLDLDCWHAFETQAPDTFMRMYQFHVQKPPMASAGARADPN